jgi:mannobiose 2-epimerase
MKRMNSKLRFTALALLLATSTAGWAQSQQVRTKIAAEMQSSMVNNLLKPWYPKAIDTANGGFLSTFTYDFKVAPNQDKMIVTQARHIWSNSKAAERFPKVAYFRSGAKHGFEFLRDKMWDKANGGFYTFTDQQGNPKQGGFAPKEAYGNSFAIYGLAAYYKVSKDTSALNLAKKTFYWLEKHSHDPKYKGYFQHMELDGTRIVRTAATPSTAELGYKDQNTSIHLLEAFTELYGVWPDPLLKGRLNEMLLLIRDRITNEKGNLSLFFQPDWTPVSFQDSTRASMKKHHGLDHVSFGHDIETAFLMLEASHALGIKNDKLTLKTAKKMVDNALANGWDKKVGGFYDEGYYFKGDSKITITEDTKNWWAQAEGMNTLLLMADYYPQDPNKYFEKFQKQWDYIKTYLIDKEHGDWYMGGLDKQPELKTALKGQIWKGTYHNLRSLINCVDRLNHPATKQPQP